MQICPTNNVALLLRQSKNLESFLEEKPWGCPSLWARVTCSSCGRARRFYCPRCLELVGQPSCFPASLATADPLPLRVEIVLRDDPTKATGLHAAVMAPLSTAVRHYPEEVRSFGPLCLLTFSTSSTLWFTTTQWSHFGNWSCFLVIGTVAKLRPCNDSCSLPVGICGMPQRPQARGPDCPPHCCGCRCQVDQNGGWTSGYLVPFSLGRTQNCFSCNDIAMPGATVSRAGCLGTQSWRMCGT